MRYIYMLPAAFLVPVIHEWVKAVVSTLQGDPTPRMQGRLTLNPFKHFEPIGFMFVLVYGFGWGNPAPTGALHYRDRQRGIIVTYVTPVLVSLLLGFGAAFLASVLAARAYSLMFDMLSIRNFLMFNFWDPDLTLIAIVLLSHFAFISINIALFNLIPVYPMAAHKLVQVFSRPDTIAWLNHYEKPMQIFLILLLAFGMVGTLFQPLSLRIIDIAWGLGG